MAPKKKARAKLIIYDAYLEIKKLTEPTELGKSLKDSKKKLAQKAFAKRSMVKLL